MHRAETNHQADHWTTELRGWLDNTARQAGFTVAGIAPVRSDESPDSSRDADRFAAWIDAGHAGEMDYLKRRDESGVLLRSSVATAFPWVRSIIVCALDYSSAAPRSVDPAPSSAGWIARYAWSGRTLDDGTTIPTDYHDDLLSRLRNIENALYERAHCDTRCYVDTGPLVERALAVQAGIGWTGKNTCLIHQDRGSWLLLGVILTSLPLEDAGGPLAASGSGSDFISAIAADRCGTCTRCIDACPTGALLGCSSPIAPREMDASRCIAYLTIEKKADVPEELRGPIGRNVFGCDICQDVCPWNVKAAKPVDKTPKQMRPRAELINPALEWLAQMDSREFRRRFRGSPLERTGRKRLLRNVAIAMGNSGDPSFIPQLQEWTAWPCEHANDVALRDAAAWALERLSASPHLAETLKITPEVP